MIIKNFQICLFALIACAFAAPQYYGGYADVVPAGGYGLVRYPNGALVPAQTPSVAAAGRAHLNAKFGLYGYHG